MDDRNDWHFYFIEWNVLKIVFFCTLVDGDDDDDDRRAHQSMHVEKKKPVGGGGANLLLHDDNCNGRSWKNDAEQSEREGAWTVDE